MRPAGKVDAHRQAALAVEHHAVATVAQEADRLFRGARVGRHQRFGILARGHVDRVARLCAFARHGPGCASACASEVPAGRVAARGRHVEHLVAVRIRPGVLAVGAFAAERRVGLEAEVVVDRVGVDSPGLRAFVLRQQDVGGVGRAIEVGPASDHDVARLSRVRAVGSLDHQPGVDRQVGLHAAPGRLLVVPRAAVET